MNINDIRSITDLPSESAALRALAWEMLREIVTLREHNALLRKEVFGSKSEKRIVSDDNQIVIEGLLEQLPPPAVVEGDEFVQVKAGKRRKHHPGRNVIPETVKTVTHVLDVPPEEKNCAACPRQQACGREELPVIEEVVRNVVERKPAEYTRHLYVRIKRGCPIIKDAVKVVEPPVVTPIAKGSAGLQLLLFVVLSKYLYHLPLYRIQRQIFHESRIWFSRATMVGWIAEMCVLLDRVYRAMIAEVKKSPVIWSDDTPLKRVTREGGAHTSAMWYYAGMGGRIVVVDYRETKGADGPRAFLKGVAPGTHLMTDANPTYNDAIARYLLIAMTCMMHIRREFVEAVEVGRHKEYAQRILRLIGQLYRLERFATVQAMTDAQRLEFRQSHSAPIMGKIKQLLLNPDFPLLPSEKIGKAILYSLGVWSKAEVFLTRGDLPIDNGCSERAIRNHAIGRKNWLFVGSDEGGERMAILQSIIITCKTNGIDIEQYLGDILMRLAIRAENANVTDLTPLEWLKARNGGDLPPVTPIYPSKN